MVAEPEDSDDRRLLEIEEAETDPAESPNEPEVEPPAEPDPVAEEPELAILIETGEAPAPAPEAPEEPEELQPEAEVEPLDPSAPLAARVEELELELDERRRSEVALQTRAEELGAVARRQGQIADELHQENRVLREGELREALAPVLRAVARLADDLERMDEGVSFEDVKFLRSQVENILHDAGITPLRPQVGDPFDARSHQAAGSDITQEEALGGTIANLRRTGLVRDDGRVMRAAEVVVYRYFPVEDPEISEDRVTPEPTATQEETEETHEPE